MMKWKKWTGEAEISKWRSRKKKTTPKKGSMASICKKTYTLASSLPRSLTGVPVRGEDRLHSASSSGLIIFPGHHEPFLLLTQTIGPTPQSTAPDPELPIATLSLRERPFNISPQRKIEREAEERKTSVRGWSVRREKGFHSDLGNFHFHLFVRVLSQFEFDELSSLSLCAGAYEYKTLHVGRRRRWRWFESLVTRLAVLIMIFGQSKEEKDSANENNEQDRGKQRSQTSGWWEGEWWLSDSHADNSLELICVKCLSRAPHPFVLPAFPLSSLPFGPPWVSHFNQQTRPIFTLRYSLE